MEKLPRISESEWQVMTVLWEASPLTANKIVEVLSQRTSWKDKTIRTLINRLVGKCALSYEKDGRRYKYWPEVTEYDCVRAETRSFLGRINRRCLKPMLASFMKEQYLTDEEIAELKRILEEKNG